ncbi:MAG TPA: hypothetical protein DCE42_08560 [Myxococcales bacterium]|nr:hypothetical protein [Myxococcales bacterium]
MRKSCIVLMLAIAMCFWAGCTKSRGGKKGKSSRWGKWKRKAKPKPVHVMRIKRGGISSILAGTTTLKAEEQVNIITQVNGLVKRVRGLEGRRFRKGSTLAVLRNPLLRIAHEKAELQVQKYKRDLARQRRLSKKGYVSKETVEVLRFQLATAENERKRTQQNLKDLRIRATIGGVVTARQLRRGAWVVPNQTAFSMEDPRSLVAEIAVPEKYLPKLQKGLKARLHAEALRGQKEIEGEVLRMAPIVDSKTGTITLTIGKLKPLKTLRSGMFVSVNLILEKRQDVPLVPKQAILYDANKPTLFRVLGDISACRSEGLMALRGKSSGANKRRGRKGRRGRKRGRKGKGPAARGRRKKGGSKGCAVEKVYFEKGIEDAQWVEVRSGLKEGDVIVSLGQDDLHSKSKVLVGKVQ